jgi:hypothetical protein
MSRGLLTDTTTNLRTVLAVEDGVIFDHNYHNRYK